MPYKRNYRPYILLGLIIALAAGVFVVIKLIPSTKRVSYREQMALGENGYFIVNGEPLADVSAPEQMSGVLYIPVDFVKAVLDPYIFWDDEAGRLSITTENRVIRMSTENLDYLVNNEPMRLSLPVYAINGQGYLPAEFVETFYNAFFSYNEDSGFAVVSMPGQHTEVASVTKKTDARFEPDIKSPIVHTIPKDGSVTLLEAYDKDSKFTKIQTNDGTVGYVASKNLTDFVSGTPRAPLLPETPLRLKKPLAGKITLLWDQMYQYEDNFRPEKFELYEGLDVISPTWFTFDESTLNGDIISIADQGYVDWAHANGYQVWGLITDSFNYDVSSAILTSTESRENAIRQLLALTALYGLDGINIDFEAVRSEDTEYYLQFLRELGPLLREQGASLSVDMFVPTFTKHYNRTEVGKVADYICVMTYDEHHATAETSGPVASLPFVDRGIADTLTEVPREKVIMGMPFYVRVWREVEKDGVFENVPPARSYTMEAAYNLFVDNGARFTWLPDIGSYYGEYDTVEEGESVTYRVWLEDLRSIEEKLALATELDIAGVACWRRGLEAEDVWDAIVGWQSSESQP